MTTNNEAFKAYLNKFKHVTGGLRVYSELNEHEKSIAKDAWQAATTEANKRIAELQASNNNLREAFNGYHLAIKQRALTVDIEQKLINLLKETPAESLQAHYDELIDRIKILVNDCTGDADLVNKIRALKEVK
jgi:hypothetical protein